MQTNYSTKYATIKLYFNQDRIQIHYNYCHMCTCCEYKQQVKNFARGGSLIRIKLL